MSGGSLDYVFGRLDDAADAIERHYKDPLHLAFAKHIRFVSKALHDCEWVMSDDYGEGEDEDAIRAVISPTSEAEVCVEMLRAWIAVGELLAKRMEGVRL